MSLNSNSMAVSEFRPEADKSLFLRMPGKIWPKITKTLLHRQKILCRKSLRMTATADIGPWVEIRYKFPVFGYIVFVYAHAQNVQNTNRWFPRSPLSIRFNRHNWRTERIVIIGAGVITLWKIFGLYPQLWHSGDTLVANEVKNFSNEFAWGQDGTLPPCPFLATSLHQC